MQWTTITTILTLLLLNTTQASAFSIARVWASFYSECPADDDSSDTPSDDPTETSNSNSILSNFFASFFQRTDDQSATVVIDVYSGTCQAFPVGRRYNADAISFNAEALYTGPYDKCNVTLHEVPGCVDAPLVEVPIQDGSAAATCTEREFHSLSQMWILLHCEPNTKSSTTSTGTSSSKSTTTTTTGGGSGQQKPSQQAQPHDDEDEDDDDDEPQSSSSTSTDPKIPTIPDIPAIPDIPKLQPTIFSKLHAALENATTATNTTAAPGAGAVKTNSTAPALSRSMRLRRAARTRLSNL
ncbi:hypothetical protein BO82DRAFT_412194 [Aspergillus uvarum CBS 121591]|uniref:Pal1-domain-containing protein n=1 Tax=Aspergillus uvarum CBS 121591 TaxID=1448315 RepID=A0A319CC90_9EURO|nr:hypothetical protein BO82DRAFT_412194 [Aspergillus uvarum CBS 121591]PYH83205.1 hypothetical protein BO82DRAFT_412194 [Aspergillus uvarum CBS 121591]